MTITQTRFRARRGKDTEWRGPGSRCRPSSPGQRRPGPQSGEGGSGARRGWGALHREETSGWRLGPPFALVTFRPQEHAQAARAKLAPDQLPRRRRGGVPGGSGSRVTCPRNGGQCQAHTARRAQPHLHGHLDCCVERWLLRLQPSSETSKESARCPGR